MTLFTHHGRQRRLLIIGIVECAVVAIIFFVIGYYSRSTGCDENGIGSKSPNSGAQSMSDKERDDLHQSIVDLMKTEELKKNLKWVFVQRSIRSMTAQQNGGEHTSLLKEAMLLLNTPSRSFSVLPDSSVILILWVIDTILRVQSHTMHLSDYYKYREIKLDLEPKSFVSVCLVIAFRNAVLLIHYYWFDPDFIFSLRY